MIQASAMDCGPAALASLLRGIGIRVSYGRLREACHTSVDGTSIDTLEVTANQLGASVQQQLVPLSHLLGRPDDYLPALALVRTPDGFAHVVVLWRRVGRYIEVMDPAIGRLWTSVKALGKRLYAHEHEVPAEAAAAWAGSDMFAARVLDSLRDAGVRPADAKRLLDSCSDWQDICRVDAAATETRAAPTPRRHALKQVEALIDPEGTGPRSGSYAVLADDGRVLARGAVLVSVTADRGAGIDPDTLPVELRAALTEPDARPLRTLVALLEPHATLKLAALGTLAVTAAALSVAFGFAFQAAVAASDAGTGVSRALAVLAALVVAGATFELASFAYAARLGRTVERAAREALESKLRRLPDAYARSRPTADMADRAHGLHELRESARLFSSAIRLSAQLVFGGVAIAVAAGTPVAAAAATVVTIVGALGAGVALRSTDHRLRDHIGALGRCTLDAALGVNAVSAHGARETMSRYQDASLERARSAAQTLARHTAISYGVASALGVAGAAAVLASTLPGLDEPSWRLAVLFWAIAMPILGHQLTGVAAKYPTVRSRVIRMLEPLMAPEVAPAPSGPADRSSASSGIWIAARDVDVVVAGHEVLHGINLDISPGEHVAVVGATGAGKSTLIGLCLGLHTPSFGSLQLDGFEDITALRDEIAWLDPYVRLWDASAEANIRYGASSSVDDVRSLLRAAGLEHLASSIPVGDNGRRLSASEAQRLRFARTLARPDARLVLLDEPFTRLDAEMRQRLLATARATWRRATLVMVTHDVRAATSLDRVVVIANGAVVEDDTPDLLLADPGSRLSTLLAAYSDAERVVDLPPWCSAGLQPPAAATL